ncbi:hypothetical protein MKW98_019451 [Papaver atlanticum]|uniref:Uncharacterized protein n=1 Tax=Papaver atlanticum TaxID=357466 RepID=A0AAD4S8C8_9MAGN|nr:hypothetical protein MKW98_019451 [Papaver atlanticum]
MLSFCSLQSSKIRLPPYSDPSNLSLPSSIFNSLLLQLWVLVTLVNFLKKPLVRQGHNVLAHSGSDYSDIAKKLGVFFLRKVFLQILPPEFDVLCTHSVFGPESGKHNWKSLPFVYDKVRIRDEESRISCCENFLNIFAQEVCRMVEMSCAEHDRDETLLNLVNTSGDFFYFFFETEIFINMAFESLKRKSYRHLHEILGKQLFKNAEGFEESDKPPSENIG